MTDRQHPEAKRPAPSIYQIKIEGLLNPLWEAEFSGLTITQEASGETWLTGPVVDQAALYGLLRKIRDLALPLVSITRLSDQHTE